MSRMKYMTQNIVFAFVFAFILGSFVNTASAVVSPGTDLEIFKGCFLQPIAGDCVKADFNHDNVINVLDLGLLKSASQYDLNGDGKVTFDL